MMQLAFVLSAGLHMPTRMAGSLPLGGQAHGSDEVRSLERKLECAGVCAPDGSRMSESSVTAQLQREVCGKFAATLARAATSSAHDTQLEPLLRRKSFELCLHDVADVSTLVRMVRVTTACDDESARNAVASACGIDRDDELSQVDLPQLLSERVSGRVLQITGRPTYVPGDIIRALSRQYAGLRSTRGMGI